MFIKIPMKIFDYRLSGNEMKVYLYLARIQNDSDADYLLLCAEILY